MEPFSTLSAPAVPLLLPNIDTDAIIPAAYLRTPSKDLRHGLFAIMRRDASGQLRPDFPLNQDRYRDARIILGGRNFGCGSSREAAVWALHYSGFRCVIASSFGDIFYRNALKNGLLPALADERSITEIGAHLQVAASVVLTVDLAGERISVEGLGDFRFTIPHEHKRNLMQGRDEISDTLTFEAELKEFQASDSIRRPWIYNRLPKSPSPEA